MNGIKNTGTGMLPMVLLLLCTSTALAQSNILNPDAWTTNGTVNAIACLGDTTYIGGSFSYVGPKTGCGVPLDLATGQPVGPYPQVSERINLVVADGSGGWYICGGRSVGTEERRGPAHILSDGLVDTDWKPEVNGSVNALAVSGETVYVGGDFTTVDGQPRNRIAALDTVTGSVTEWNPDLNDVVHALAVSGGTVYVGGKFTRVDGQRRERIAAFDTETGATKDWPAVANNTVTALVFSGETLYVGGYFTTFGGQPRNRLASLDVTMEETTVWNPNANATVLALAVSGADVYVCGNFTNIGGQPRNGIAAVDAVTGGVTGWNPTTDGTVCTLAVSGTTVCAGGWFDHIGGSARSNLALIDRVTGNATDWTSHASYYVTTVAVADGIVYAGGDFNSVSGERRLNIAALDGAGRATTWNPGPDGMVNALAVSETKLYAGGNFSTFGGKYRRNLAAIDAATGEVTSWIPNPNQEVTALAVSGGKVYAGGIFTTIGGKARRNLAAIDFYGDVNDWNPDANGSVSALAVAGTNVYAGGSFSNVNGKARNNLVAIDAVKGTATSWNPDVNGRVRALAVAGTNIYAGGDFTQIGGTARDRIGAVSIITGTVKDWNPGADKAVYALAASGREVYAVGKFGSIGGQERYSIAKIDAATGNVTDWAPTITYEAKSVVVSGAKLHVGCSFFFTANIPYAQFDVPDTMYLLTYLEGINGSITGEKVQTISNGADGGEVKAVPAEGYHFLRWSDGVMTTRRVDTNVTGNLTVTAIFEGPPHFLDYGAGSGGSISGVSPQTISPGSSGSAVTAVPETGHHFVRWSDGSTQNPRTDTNVTGDVSVTAEFAVNTYLLTYLAAAGGSIAGESPQTVNYGSDSVAVTAIPDTGFHFVQWGDGSTMNPRTDTDVRHSFSVMAEFAINIHVLAYGTGPGGAISGAALQTVAYGADATAVEAVPTAGHHFVRWSDGSAQNPRMDMNVAGDLAVTAEFAINRYVLSYLPDVNGAVTGPTPQTVDHGQDGAPVTAAPDTGYHFVRWSDGSARNPRTDRNVTGGLEVTAKFSINRYTLTYMAGANGSITGTAAQEVRHGENGAPVEAVPDTGHRFVVWSDGSAQNPRTDLNVTTDVTVTAAFAVIRCTLFYTAGAGGAILGAAAQSVLYGSGGTAVEAVPEEGYHFVRWSDGSVENPRLDVNVTADLAVTAEFAVNTYTLTYTAGAGGAIAGESPQTVLHGSGGTAVEAVPQEGYHFVQWSDGSVENPRLDLDVTSDLAVTAEFAVDSPEGEGEGEGEGEPPVPPTAEEARALLAAGFDAADTDGDGSISFAEAAAAVEGLTRTVFDELDANADGVLDRAELGLDVDDGCGCGCVKSDFSPAGLKNRLGDLFLAGLLVGMLAVWQVRRK